MKEKGLTLIEAWRAADEGRCVKNRNGNAFRIFENCPEWWDCFRSDAKWRPSSFNGFTADYEPFSIVPDPSIPEPKSLSFEEAVDFLKSTGKKVKITSPDDALYLEGCPDPWQYPILDLAERKGWRITVAQ